MKITISKHFQPLLEDRSRYLVLCGGAGSGKSEFCGRKLFWRHLTEGRHRFLVLRKVRNTCTESVLELIKKLLEANEHPYDYNKTERRMTIPGPKGTSEILFDGMDDPEKIKSIKGITSVWLEEATELALADFRQIDLRLREPGPSYHQIILSFNPDEAQGPWLKEMFFDDTAEAIEKYGAIRTQARVDVSTVEDNPVKNHPDLQKYRQQLDDLCKQDETTYKIYRQGLWAAQRGRIFNWDERALPLGKIDDKWYGGDFGYSIDPAGVVRIYRKADEVWLEEVLYRTGLTNQALGTVMIEEGVDPNDLSYWDSAEPKSIDELRNMGFNALPCEKGPDSVRAGLDFVRACKVHMIPGRCPNLKAEMLQYHWREDKKGNPLNEPVKFKDHLMSAVRYGIATHLKEAGAYLGVFDFDIRPA